MNVYHATMQQLRREIQDEFSRLYPYLKIEFLTAEKEIRPSPEEREDHKSEDSLLAVARHWLEKDIQESDHMKVSELEEYLWQLFGNPVQILRRSGNFWMETRMTRNWTLKQHNDHGQDITSGFQ